MFILGIGFQPPQPDAQVRADPSPTGKRGTSLKTFPRLPVGLGWETLGFKVNGV